jgi:hypothetical protein
MMGDLFYLALDCYWANRLSKELTIWYTDYIPVCMLLRGMYGINVYSGNNLIMSP